MVACRTCSGSGAKPGTSPTTCGMCRGRGQVGTRQGFLTIATDCPTCRGTGQVITQKCEDCGGRGATKQHETLSVSVPAGIDDGQTLRVPGRGMAGRGGGPAGHLYVTFRVEPDPRFEREGDHLITQVPITYSTAVLGGRVMVPTLDEDVEVEVEAGTQPGAVHVLRGRGMPNVHGRGSGDLAVRFTIAVPTAPSDEERKLLEHLRSIEQPAAAHAPRVTDEEEDHGGFFNFRRKKKR
jgi:molecular chaperone DnaJ